MFKIHSNVCTNVKISKSFYVVTVSGCACPGSTLTYKCIVMGSRGGAAMR